MMIRALKELRALAWPAVLILGSTALAVAWRPGTAAQESTTGAVVLAFLLGTGLLVALPFGEEFQQRTMPLLLAQPVSRARIWIEKWLILAAVVVLLAAVHYAFRQAGPSSWQPGARELTFLAVMLGSGMFWSLVAGSTIGGLAFTLAAAMLVETGTTIAVGLFTGADVDMFASHPALVAARISYALLTLWLGWRTFERLEVSGQGSISGGRVVGSSGAIEALRCRPTGAVFNLARKELRLQQPTFLVAAAFAACWVAAMLFFALVPDRPRGAEVVFTVLLMIYIPLALVVAGTISFGEDTALGIRAWHLTLPISSRTQWLVKLGAAVFVAALLVLALPAVLVRLPALVLTLPAGSVLLPATPQVWLTLSGLLLLSFWASTLFGHTVKAAVATGFAALTVAACVNAAMWMGQRWRVGSELLTGYMVNQQLPPDALSPQLFRQFRSGALIAALCLVALIGLRQSLAAFRHIDIGRRAIARASVVLACTAVVLTFIPFAYFWAASDQYRSEPVRELTASLAVVTSAETSAGAFPERVTIAQLEATGLLSDATRRWIAGSDISLSAMPQHSTSRRRALATLTFPGGRVYRFFYEVPRADR